MAFVIQSAFTGCFLAPDPHHGQPIWVTLLKDAQSVPDMETAVAMIEDHLDDFHRAIVVDLESI